VVFLALFLRVGPGIVVDLVFVLDLALAVDSLLISRFLLFPLVDFPDFALFVPLPSELDLRSVFDLVLPDDLFDLKNGK